MIMMLDMDVLSRVVYRCRCRFRCAAAVEAAIGAQRVLPSPGVYGSPVWWCKSMKQQPMLTATRERRSKRLIDQSV